MSVAPWLQDLGKTHLAWEQEKGMKCAVQQDLKYSWRGTICTGAPPSSALNPDLTWEYTDGKLFCFTPQLNMHPQEGDTYESHMSRLAKTYWSFNRTVKEVRKTAKALEFELWHV